MTPGRSGFFASDSRYALTATLLLIVFAGLALDFGRKKSATWDEPGHLAAGYSYWAYGDYGTITYNLFLAQKFLALPLVWLRPALPPKTAATPARDPGVLGQSLLFAEGVDHRTLLGASRAMVTLAGVFLGVTVLLGSAALFGRTGGIVSLAAFATCPPLITHSALATTDLVATLLLLLATLAWWRLLHRVGPLRLLLAGLSLGALLLTKYSSIAFFGVAAVLLVGRIWRGPPLLVALRGGNARILATRAEITRALVFAAGGVGVVAWIAVWAFFGFQRNPGAFPYDWTSLTPGTLTYRGIMLLRTTGLFPDPFLFDLGGLRSIHAPRPSFLAGHYALGGQPLFFPIAFLVKTPLATLALIGVGGVGVACFRRRIFPAPDACAPLALAYRVWPLLALIGVYGALSVRSNVNIGLRHLLPVYPAALMLAGGSALFLDGRRRRLAAAGLLLSGGGLTLASLEAHPDELAWANTFAGGPARSYAWLIDSSSDWGEELPALNTWLSDPARPAWAKAVPVFLAYFGVTPPRAYGLEVEQIDGVFPAPAFNPARFRPGRYIISPTIRQGGSPSVFGPWSRAHEADYLSMLAQATAPDGASRLNPSQHLRLHQLFRARLCSRLRLRPADARIGAGFFVYRLDRAELDLALRGEPVELIDSLPASLPMAR